jgi:hypothetical protein
MQRLRRRLSIIAAVAATAALMLVGAEAPALADGWYHTDDGYGHYEIWIDSLSDSLYIPYEIRDTSCDGSNPGIQITVYSNSGTEILTRYVEAGSGCGTGIYSSLMYYASDLNGNRDGYVVFKRTHGHSWWYSINDWGSSYFHIG